MKNAPARPRAALFSAPPPAHTHAAVLWAAPPTPARAASLRAMPSARARATSLRATPSARARAVFFRATPSARARAALLLIALSACKPREDPQQNAREAEARTHREQGDRSADQSARQLESEQAKQLLLLYEARRSALGDIARREAQLASPGAKQLSQAAFEEQRRLLEHDRAGLARTEGEIATQKRLVEANRDRLVRLKAETSTRLSTPEHAAGPSPEVLRARLEGIEASLAETTGALAVGAETG